MAWFQRNKSPDLAAAAPATHLQGLKRKARNRLIGMAVLVLGAVITFTWVLDTQPRPADREIMYEIPARGESSVVRIPAKAMAQAAQDAAASPDPAAASSPASAPAPAAPVTANKVAKATHPADDTPASIRARRLAALSANEQLVDDAPIAPGSAPLPPSTASSAANKLADTQTAKAAKAAAAEKAKKEQEKRLKAEHAAKLAAEKTAADKSGADKTAADKAAAKKSQEAARALALLNGGNPSSASDDSAPSAPSSSTKASASSSRSVVQFGSFSDSDTANQVRHKVEGAGLKTYTQTIDTPRGPLIRLRVGPFSKPEDAAAAAKKIKALGLPAAVLTL